MLFAQSSTEVAFFVRLDLAFNNVKPNDWYFVLIRFNLGQKEKSLNVPTKVKISKKKLYFFSSKPL